MFCKRSRLYQTSDGGVGGPRIGLREGMATNSTRGSIRGVLTDGSNFWAFQSLDLVCVDKHVTSRAGEPAEPLSPSSRRSPVSLEFDTPPPVNILGIMDSMENPSFGVDVVDRRSMASSSGTTGSSFTIFNDVKPYHLLGKIEFVPCKILATLLVPREPIQLPEVTNPMLGRRERFHAAVSRGDTPGLSIFTTS